MFRGHPWEGELYGSVEYHWYMARHYVFNVEFDVNMRPFIDFCKNNGLRSNQLVMKIGHRLSVQYLPQRAVSLNWKSYPARYPAGFVRPVRPGSDMLEHVGVRELEGKFVERTIRSSYPGLVRWMAGHQPRAAVWLAKHVFASRDVKNNYALMVSRNPLRNLGTRVVFHGTHYRTFVLTIPYGEKVTMTFGAPHAFANIQYFEPFLIEVKNSFEKPETIPRELLDKPYRQAPPSEESDFKKS